jgi:lysophospholipase L1-like esterase
VACGVLAFAELRQRRRELTRVTVVDAPAGIKYALTEAPNDGARGWWTGRTPTAAATDARRLLIVGDSVSYGVSVSHDDTWASQLGVSLGVEVVNLAMNGWDAAQSMSLLEAVGRDWRPDAVLYGAYTNDGLPTYVLYGEQTRDPVFVGTEVPEAAQLVGPRLGEWLLSRSALFRRLQGAAYARAAAGTPSDFDAAWFGAQLDRLRVWADNNDVPVGVVALAPHVLADAAACPAAMGDPALCTSAERAYATIVEQSGARRLSVAETLPALQDSGERAFYPAGTKDPDHPGPEGHALFARAAEPLARELLGMPVPAEAEGDAAPRAAGPARIKRLPSAAPRVPRGGRVTDPRRIRRPGGG